MKKIVFASVFGIAVAAFGAVTKIQMPPACTTPDGMAIDAAGRLVIAAPNNDRRAPGAIFRMDTPDGAPYKWFDVPVNSETGFAAPMGVCFGPEGELEVELQVKLGGGMWRAAFRGRRPLASLLDEFGRTPVPPYVRREGTREEEAADRERYQTIYAKHVGSVAAPTAGLHFTPEIFAALDAKGVRRASVTLHVGPGTFRPVKTEQIEDHHMDFEAFTVPPETADAVNACKARGGRVFCVGSTTVRTLETVAARTGDETPDPLVVPGSGASDIFIYPPYRFRVCDCMLTNFHLPQSTLLMMVSALAGRERVLCSYALAVRANYRFFSYGDCMLIV